MKIIKINLILVLFHFFALASIKPCFSQSTVEQNNRKLIWSDEFNVNGLPDKTKWSYDVGSLYGGWGNNELEYYTERRKENARVENGNLIIEARKEKMQSFEYTSARLVSRGKGDWTYGRIEVRAKLPAGRGIWPAIWMMPTKSKYGGWPKSGEIDVMENVGYMPDSIFATVHTEAHNHKAHTSKSQGFFGKDFSTDFHVYAIEWTPDRIDFFLDGKQYHQYINEKKGADQWPFDIPFHLLLNVAVGGSWGGTHGVDDGIFPQQMLIDYVRVYQ